MGTAGSFEVCLLQIFVSQARSEVSLACELSLSVHNMYLCVHSHTHPSPPPPPPHPHTHIHKVQEWTFPTGSLEGVQLSLPTTLDSLQIVRASRACCGTQWYVSDVSLQVVSSGHHVSCDLTHDKVPHVT